MASGHASRIIGRTHGCSDQTCDVNKVLANTEPSTHGTFQTKCPFVRQFTGLEQTCFHRGVLPRLTLMSVGM